MKALRGILGVVVVVVMAIAIFGIAQGKNEFQGQPEPTTAQTAASKRQIAADPDAVAGKRVFAEEGCNRCHAMAAIGANGKLGPRMDSIPDPASDDAEYIARSKRDSDNIMPRDYGTRMSPTELKQVSALVHAAFIKGTGD